MNLFLFAVSIICQLFVLGYAYNLKKCDTNNESFWRYWCSPPI